MAEIESEELDDAKTLLFKLVQGKYFCEEIKCSISEQYISKRSKLKLLCLLIDKNGLSTTCRRAPEKYAISRSR